MEITIAEIRVAYRKIRALRKRKIDLKEELKEVDKEIDTLYRAVEDNLLETSDGQMRLGGPEAASPDR